MGIFGDIAEGLFGGGGPDVTGQTGFATLPGFAQDAFRDLVTRGVDLSQQTAPFELNELQRLGIERATGRAGTGFGFGQRGSEQFTRAGDALQQVAPETLGAGRFIQQAGGDIRAGAAPITGAEFGTSLQSFTNPFTQQVLDPALADLRKQTRGAFSDIGAGATGAGAFGGQRQALLESEAATAAGREAGRLSGQLRQQGFESGAQRALSTLESNRQRALQAGQLGLGQAGQQLALAGGLRGAGQAQAGLGTDLLGARQTVTNVRGQEARLPIEIGQILQQQQQIPLQQLRFLGETLGRFPSGSVQQTPEQGFFQSPVGGALGTAAGGFLSDLF